MPAARPAVAPLLALCLGACGTGSEHAVGVGGGGQTHCQAPSRSVNGECREPGVQDDGCPAGSWLTQGGSCEPAGIPPEACAEGFVPTAERGCEPILPAGPCPPGLMALPGETVCRNQEVGVAVVGAEAQLVGVRIVDTQARPADDLLVPACSEAK